MNNRKLFLAAIAAGDELDIAHCAMIIAGELQPGLDVQDELKAIDQLTLSAQAFPVVDARSLVEFVANKERYIGNTADYYSVSNSLLNQVLSSKKGIPITLALVYLSIAQKLNSDSGFLETHPLYAWGINFPGHFLVGIRDSEGEHLIDPFQGVLVSKEDCYSTIANLYDSNHVRDYRDFDPADSAQILRRILENLKIISLNTGHAKNAMMCLDYQLMLYPEAVDLLQQQEDLLAFLRDKNLAGESRLQ